MSVLISMLRVSLQLASQHVCMFISSQGCVDNFVICICFSVFAAHLLGDIICEDAPQRHQYPLSIWAFDSRADQREPDVLKLPL
eukprot:scaffold671013_cov62-Prasinocladus_malaysianus.AAC.1